MLNYKRLFKNETVSDVYFVVVDQNGAKQRIPALKPLLAAYSPVFDRMFYGELKETGDVEITDVSAEAFEEFLQFFYATEFRLTTENLPAVVKLVDKYDTAAFRPTCEKHLIKILSVNVAYVFYEVALTYNLSRDIVEQCEEAVCADPKQALQLGAIGGSNVRALANILQSHRLICREIDVFEGTMSWPKLSLQNKGITPSTDNIKTELGDCLYYIRFPKMTADQFVDCIEKYPELLPAEEYLDILQYIIKKRPLTAAATFNTSKRLGGSVITFIANNGSFRHLVASTQISFALLKNTAKQFRITVLMDRSNALVKKREIEITISDDSNSIVFYGMCPIISAPHSCFLKCIIQPMAIKIGAHYLIDIRCNRATSAKLGEFQSSGEASWVSTENMCSFISQIFIDRV